jgi:hypothetical protein
VGNPTLLLIQVIVNYSIPPSKATHPKDFVVIVTALVAVLYPCGTVPQLIIRFSKHFLVYYNRDSNFVHKIRSTAASLLYIPG